jgi:hypothetical protein
VRVAQIPPLKRTRGGSITSKITIEKTKTDLLSEYRDSAGNIMLANTGSGKREPAEVRVAKMKDDEMISVFGNRDNYQMIKALLSTQQSTKPGLLKSLDKLPNTTDGSTSKPRFAEPRLESTQSQRR